MSKKMQAIILGIMCLILTIGICIQIKTVNNIITNKQPINPNSSANIANIKSL